MPQLAYTPAEVEELLDAERRATIRAMIPEVRHALAEALRAGPTVLTTAEVADREGVSPATVRRWFREEGLPGHAMRGTYYVREEDLDAWLAGRDSD